jgi:DNA polymerase III epsilon subunit-like protein
MVQVLMSQLHRAGQKFDVPFLKLELQRCGLEVPSRWLWADSLKFARNQWPEVPPDRRYGLQLLRAHFGLPEGQVGQDDATGCICASTLLSELESIYRKPSRLLMGIFTLPLLQAHRALADVELLRNVFLRMLSEKTGQDFDAKGLVGLFTSQWAGSVTDIGELP